MSDSAGKTSAKAPASAGAQHARPRSPGPAPALGGFDALWKLQGMAGNRAVSGALGATSGGGMPLPTDVRADMESRFGADFADVRVHDDAQAHHSATGLASHAYTHGEHIVFNANRFAPHSGDGRRLLAHELAHVVQQRRGGATPALDPQAPHEQAADHAADAVMAGSAPVAVAGGTGVGVACDNWFSDKYKALKEEIPPEYRSMVRSAVKGGANAVVNTVGMVGFVPPPVTEGLGETIVKSLDDIAEGGGAQALGDNFKNLGRDKLLDGIGIVNGVVKQVTEIADTGMWVAQETRDLRNSAVDAAGGKESFGGGLARSLFDQFPGAASIDSLAATADALQASGSKDHFGRASLTAPYAEWANELVKDVEETLGVADDEGLFTRTEQKELETMIVTQVGLSLIGVEEVKIVLNVVGALSSVRGVVETMRHNKNWASDPTFWGHIIGGVLSVVGLGSSIAKPKIIQMVLKFGWVAAAVPPMAAMLIDYKAYLNGELTEDQLDERLKKHFAAACNVIKDGILHISQSGAGKAPGPSGGKPPAKTAAGGGDAETPATPAAKDNAAAPAAKETATTPTPQDSPVGLPPPQGPKLAPPRETPGPAPAADDANVVPLEQGRALPQSKASKKLENALAKQPAGEAGSVTPLRPRQKPAAAPPDSEPQSQPLPVEQKLAVGQTHGADGGGGPAPGQKPPLRLLPDADAPRASASNGGGPSRPPDGGGVRKPPVSASGGPSRKNAPSTPRGPGPKKSRPKADESAPKQEKARPKEDKPKGEADAKAKVLEMPIEQRLKALEQTEVPDALKQPTADAIALIRKTAAKDPDSARKLLAGLEDLLEDANVVLPGQTLEPETRKMLGGAREHEGESRAVPEETKNLPERADERFPWQTSEEEAVLLRAEFPDRPGGWREQRPVRSRPAGSPQGSGKSGSRRSKKPSEDREEVFASEDDTDFVVVNKGRTQKGDTKPELFHPGGDGKPPISVEVKNWPLGDEAVAAESFLMSDFLLKTGHQAQLRAANLPADAQQWLIIDLRGQQVSKASQEGIARDLEVSSNGAYNRERIRFLTSGWGE